MVYWNVCREKFHTSKDLETAKKKIQKEIDKCMLKDGYSSVELTEEINRNPYENSVQIRFENPYAKKTMRKLFSGMIR